MRARPLLAIETRISEDFSMEMATLLQFLTLNACTYPTAVSPLQLLNL